MRRQSLLAFVTVLGIAAWSLAGQAATAKPAASAVKPKSAWASGHLERVDAAARNLIVKQGTHEMTFSLAPDARLAEGKKPLTLDQLAAETGHSVRVEYHMEGTAKTATLIEVGTAHAEKSAAAPKPAIAPKPATPPSK
jgi:hypothetical protein